MTGQFQSERLNALAGFCIPSPPVQGAKIKRNTMKTLSLFRTALSGLTLLAATILLSPVAVADDSALSSKDKSFIKDAYQDGLAEVQGAEMAQRKTGNADVKAFAEKIAADHSAANNDLKALAEAKKVTLASGPSMVAQGKGKLLDGKTGADFEKAYIDGMVSDHKKDIEAFEKTANEAQDADVKALANKILPKLKEHLSIAEGIQQKIGK
jgi:putative membrane protein